FDGVVIGGAITGAGVALDAGSRGYSVAILERADWAIGTSSRSSKMVHGGLRYLQNFDLGLVREALLERQLMVQLAPHLVYPIPFLVPTLGESRRSRRIGIGLNMYDVMATTRVGQGRRERQARERSRELNHVDGVACIVPAGEERTIFALPWYGRALIGTTDRDYEGDIAQVEPSGEDIEYLLDAANSFFGTDIGTGDLTGAYAGVRPLISTGDPRKSVDISRRAELYETSSGLLTITGGKLTTWRRMAKQVVDRMVEREGRQAPCQTSEIPLGMPASDEDLSPPHGLDEDDLPDGWRDLLALRYG